MIGEWNLVITALFTKGIKNTLADTLFTFIDHDLTEPKLPEKEGFKHVY